MPPTLSEWLAVVQPTMAPGDEGKFWLQEGNGSYSVIGGIPRAGHGEQAAVAAGPNLGPTSRQPARFSATLPPMKTKLVGLFAALSVLGAGFSFGATHVGAAETDRLRNAISAVCVLPGSAGATTGDFCAPEAESIAIASAARSSTNAVSSADFTADGYRGVRCITNVSANLSGITITTTIQGKDAVSGSYYTLANSTGATGTAAYHLALGPGVATTANFGVGAVIPATWRVTATPGSASASTWGVSCGRTP